MAREQVLQQINLSMSTTPVQFSASVLLVTSFIIQAPYSNTDFLKIGNAAGQSFQLAPGKDLEVNGDNLDNGTTAYMDLSKWYVVATSGTQAADISYLAGY